MSEYVLDHHDKAERPRLALMSQLLDPMQHRYIEELGIGPGDRTLEVGCGNGSVSAWLAELVLPEGRAVAVDLDLSLIESSAPNLEFREADILAGPVAPGDFDLVTARAILHHLARSDDAIANIAASVRPGGSILLIEPDFLPVSVAEPAPVAAFWQGWLAWSRGEGIDYFIGPTASACVGRAGHATDRGHRRDRALQRWFAVGAVLDANGRRVARPTPGVGRTRRSDDRRVPRPLR
jgi:SAM-dependent methyltransferase